ncbi:MAG: DUF5719 family protein, partial [Actinomycetota bacterium]|nr:DUF5719 family protein [Actinomycetota bacterium]
PATTRPETDWAVLLNPGSEQVEASIALLRASGPPLRPTALRTLRVGPGARLRVPLGAVTRGEPYAVVVSATGPVVAERFSYSRGAGDVASAMGVPLD